MIASVNLLFNWTEIATNTLEARFPPHIPTHSEYQRFHFDPATGLLAQYDYTAEAFGSLAKAAQLILEHGKSGAQMGGRGPGRY